MAVVDAHIGFVLLGDVVLHRTIDDRRPVRRHRRDNSRPRSTTWADMAPLAHTNFANITVMRVRNACWRTSRRVCMLDGPTGRHCRSMPSSAERCARGRQTNCCRCPPTVTRVVDVPHSLRLVNAAAAQSVHDTSNVQAAAHAPGVCLFTQYSCVAHALYNRNCHPAVGTTLHTLYFRQTSQPPGYHVTHSEYEP